jgi:hypothetical protein
MRDVQESLPLVGAGARILSQSPTPFSYAVGNGLTITLPVKPSHTYVVRHLINIDYTLVFPYLGNIVESENQALGG